jgi:hypothetical protein
VSLIKSGFNSSSVLMIPEPTFPLSDLGVWIRFAVSKGGLATAVALVDTLAVNQDQLMFLAEDDVIILYVFADGLSYLVSRTMP